MRVALQGLPELFIRPRTAGMQQGQQGGQVEAWLQHNFTKGGTGSHGALRGLPGARKPRITSEAVRWTLQRQELRCT